MTAQTEWLYTVRHDLLYSSSPLVSLPKKVHTGGGAAGVPLAIGWATVMTSYYLELVIAVCIIIL